MKGIKMTDITKYRNVSLTHQTYKTLIALSKVLLPDVPFVIEATRCDGKPDCPANNILPQPQLGPPGATAKDALEHAKKAEVINNFLIVIPSWNL